MISSLKTIDLHQDILLNTKYPDSQKDDSQTSFDMLKAANIKIVLGSVFPIPPQENFFHPKVNSLITSDINSYINQCKLDINFSIIFNKEVLNDIITSQTKYGIIIHIEGLNVFKDQCSDWRLLENWFNLGLRSIGPIWNLHNSFGGGAQDNQIGLTSLGHELIEWAENKGVLIDFAHMNPKTFMGAAKISNKPILVSHGNAYDLCSKIRNYDKLQLKQIAESNGVIGIFFAGNFIKPSGQLNLQDVVDHFDYIKKTIGINHISIGSDFGGIINRKINGLAKSTDLPALYQTLEKRGYTQNEIQKISYENALRVLNSNIQS